MKEPREERYLCSRTDFLFSCMAFVFSIGFALFKFYLLENDENNLATILFDGVSQNVFDSVQKTFNLGKEAPVLYANFLLATYGANTQSTTRQHFRAFSQTRSELQV